MKKITIIFILLLTSGLFAQTLQIGPSFGFYKPQELSVDNLNSSDFDLSVDSDIHYGVTAKIGLGVKLVGHIYKISLAGSETIGVLGNSYDISYEADMWSMGIGTEMTLIPGPANIYLAGDLLINSITDSKVTFKDYPQFSGNGEDETYYGLGVGAGVQISMIDINLKYNMNSLFSDAEMSNTIALTASILFGL